MRNSGRQGAIEAIEVMDDNDRKSDNNGRDEESGVARSVKCCDARWKKIAWGIFVAFLLLLGIVLLATSLKKLNSTEYGVQYNVHSKKLDDAARTGGLHAGPPGYEFIKFPSTFVTVDLPSDICVSRNGLRVQFDVTFQYQMPEPWLVDAVVRFRDFERWSRVVEAAGNSAIHHTCSEFSVSSFQQERGGIQNAMMENLKLKLEGASGEGHDGVYARAVSLQLRYVGLPAPYKEAVSQKQQATEEIELAKNQRIQETTKATTDLLSATEEAKRVNDTTINDASIILTEASIKAQETLFAFETEANVIVTVKNRLNLTASGVLAYLSNRLYASTGDLKIQTAEPARLSRRDEL